MIFHLVSFQPIYYASKFSTTENFTFSTLLTGELIEIRILLDGPQSGLVLNYSTCHWEKPKDVELSLKSNINFDKTSIKLQEDIPYNTYHLQVNCFIGIFRHFSFLKKYWIYGTLIF